MISDIESLTLNFKRMASVTWTDEETDAKIKGIIEDASPKMDHMLGAEIDYSAPGEERELFINYCLYRWNGVSELFQNNYLSDILRVRHKYEVKNAK